MGIQFKQIDGLDSTFSSLSGDLQGQISSNTNAASGLLSGSSTIGGWKYFIGNADFSGAQGILVDPNSIYTPNNVFAGGMKVGFAISTPRNSTTGPEGVLQVTGGQIYFENQLNIRNSAGISISNGAITGAAGNFNTLTGSTIAYGSGNFTGSLTVGGNPVSTGGAYYAGTGLGLIDNMFFTSGDASFESVTASGFNGGYYTGTSGEFNDFKITGLATGFLRLHKIPDYTETGNIPDPATGTVFRSGNYLMIV